MKHLLSAADLTRADATAILDKINASITKAKSDGAYDEIYKKWFAKEYKAR